MAPPSNKRNRNNKSGFKRFNKRPKFEKQPFTRKPFQKREYTNQDQLKESDVGIIEYINPYEGFSGVIKARFSDFQVNEINLDGRLAKLTDNKIPKDFKLTPAKLDYNNCSTSPIKQIDQETWEKLKKLVDSIEPSDMVTLNADDLDKDDRRRIHECAKSYFGQKLVVSTKNEENKKIIEFRKYDKTDKPDDRSCWPQDKGEYVHFLLYKEALDTMAANLKISSCLRMSPSDFTYAGVKDKRAKTTQWFCVRKVEPWKLIMKTRFVRNIKVGNIEFKNEPLKIGQLSGNKFRIALRNVLGEDDIINKSMEHIKTHGFINYYGLQRFGNDKEVPTYSIGINLLLGNWEKAVELILKPRAGDDPELDISKAKKVYAESKDAEKALDILDGSRNICIEAKLLEGISKNNENDYVTALEKIPRNIRLLYLHSFQSLIWNKMVSKRIAEFGYKPVVGDLVFCDENASVINVVEHIDKHVILSDADENSSEEEFKCKREVKILTTEDVNQYTIFDIVLPLPGYDVVYPEHLKESYKAALEEHGLSLEMTKQKVKTYNLCGDYRKMLGRVQDFSWKIMRYNDPTDNLIRSDFEELKGEPEPESIEGGKYKALIMEFALTPSSYATMVLREALKTETSSSAQAKLNDYHETTQDEKKKIILEGNEDQNNVEKEEKQNEESGSSLLANKEKYEEFKNSIFQSILENPMKREHENDDEDEDKEVTTSKKAKSETEDTAIKMEASLV